MMMSTSRSCHKLAWMKPGMEVYIIQYQEKVIQNCYLGITLSVLILGLNQPRNSWLRKVSTTVTLRYSILKSVSLRNRRNKEYTGIRVLGGSVTQYANAPQLPISTHIIYLSRCAHCKEFQKAEQNKQIH